MKNKNIEEDEFNNIIRIYWTQKFIEAEEFLKIEIKSKQYNNILKLIIIYK